ncbi:MAG TPA: hypothetical protein VGH60_01025 [Solirubrobacteraceae bacterium]|jgi:hypothetical protein
MFDDVIGDEEQRALAEQMLISASRAVFVDVDRVEFGDRDIGGTYSWLCYLADPKADDLMDELTLPSAVHHFNRFDPGGFLTSTGKRLVVNVHELEASHEASIFLPGTDGQDVLRSAWQENLLFIRVTFTYRELE